MGRFNDVFRILCDEAFFVSGKEFALAWNEKLHGEKTSIDESTVNRWKYDTLPRQFYLPKIVKLCNALSAERNEAGEPGALSPAVRDKLIEACAGDGPAKELSEAKSERVFVARALEAAYLTQKTARYKTGATPSTPTRGRRKARLTAVAIAAAGAAVAIVLYVLLFVPPAASPQPSDAHASPADGLETVGRDNVAPLGKAVANGDHEAARRLVAAGERVNAPLYKGDGPKLDFLRRACEGPVSPFPASGRLEESEAAWGVYWGDLLPCFAFARGSPPGAPGAGGEPLRLSYLGGEPYSFAHFYLNLEPRRGAVRFRVRVRLSLDRPTTFNNEDSASIVQAVEVSVSKFEGKKRFELAWQWENMGEGSPQWRYWDPARNWVASGLPARSAEQWLKPRTWHDLEFTGRATGNAVFYDSLSVDGVAYAVAKTVGAAALAEPLEYLAAAVQLDGNSRSDAYDVYVEDFTFSAME